jgi:glycosyltransferase involved in cell wall biosynthesis
MGFINMPKKNIKTVDIIIPVYNSEKVIAKTLNYILKSRYTEFKIVISDDCSTDSTVNIIKQYQEEYPEKIVLHVNEENLGVTKNCNICLMLTNADIVMFCGHDDYFYEDKIFKCLQCFEDNPKVSLVYHDCDIIVDNTKIFKYSDTHFNREGDAWNYLIYGCISAACTVCVKGDILNKVMFREEVGVVSDFVLFYEIAKHGGIKYIDEVLGAHVRHKGSVSSILRYKEDFQSIKASLYILENFKDDRIPALINYQWGMIRLLSKNKIHLLFYLFSPIVALLWIMGVKIAKKKIP